MILDGTISGKDLAPQTAEREFLSLLNAYRKENGLQPMDWLASLQMAATWKSKDMGVNKYFSHTDSRGRSPFALMQWCGYDRNSYKGENLAAGYVGAQAVFTAWKSSSGHNSNMLGQHYRYCGIALVIVPGSPYGYYWATEFASLFDPTWTGYPEGTTQPSVLSAATRPVKTFILPALVKEGQLTKVPDKLPKKPTKTAMTSTRKSPRKSTQE